MGRSPLMGHFLRRNLEVGRLVNTVAVVGRLPKKSVSTRMRTSTMKWRRPLFLASPAALDQGGAFPMAVGFGGVSICHASETMVMCCSTRLYFSTW